MLLNKMIDRFIHKIIEFKFSGESLKFATSRALFSSAKVDEGTKELLNSLRKNEAIKYKKILDLGSGYGTLGIFLKKKYPLSKVICTDRDFLAVEFSKYNSELNNCEIEGFPSLDYENVSGKFDLILCNFPAKLGKNGLKKFVWNASKFLEKNGILSIVIVKELEKEFDEITRDEMEIKYCEKKNRYNIYHLSFSKEIDYSEDPYVRGEMKLVLGRNKYFLKTALDIPEFDSLHYSTINIMNKIKSVERVEEVAILNPFNGAKALIALYYLRPKKIILISRDLLSLKYSKENLEKIGFKNIQISFPNEKISSEILIGTTGKDENFNSLDYEKMFKNFKKIIFSLEEKKFLGKNGNSEEKTGNFYCYFFENN